MFGRDKVCTNVTRFIRAVSFQQSPIFISGPFMKTARALMAAPRPISAEEMQRLCGEELPASTYEQKKVADWAFALGAPLLTLLAAAAGYPPRELCAPKEAITPVFAELFNRYRLVWESEDSMVLERTKTEAEK